MVRSTVPRINLDDVFTTKEEIASEVKSMLEKAMTEFGYAIIQTLVTDIAPDQKVKIAMNEINAAQRQRVAAQDRAEAEKIMVGSSAELSGFPVGLAKQVPSLPSFAARPPPLLLRPAPPSSFCGSPF